MNNLGQNKIDKEGMSLLNLVLWPKLKILTLSNNPIGNEGCKHLHQSKLKLLEFLALCRVYAI